MPDQDLPMGSFPLAHLVGAVPERLIRRLLGEEPTDIGLLLRAAQTDPELASYLTCERIAVVRPADPFSLERWN